MNNDIEILKDFFNVTEEEIVVSQSGFKITVDIQSQDLEFAIPLGFKVIYIGIKNFFNNTITICLIKEK